MLLNELTAGPITIEGIAMDAMDHLPKWLGTPSSNETVLARDIATKLPKFIKQHPRYSNENDRAFMSDNLLKIGKVIMSYIQKQK